ncbi:AAA family ATPase [Aeromicrobium sp. SMF47]|uniref:AAA family ATPase n=1 Tax=Aeromicrobium yanjiei TaxID=2662028 RepID=A0A5Q2MC65_9ACTN|nr:MULTISPECIES: ArsA-related P-loop ATPase [Aeromicrobium]MRJ75393.1 AAA family ATPase [Aeromicrobium yanjiei]MRK02549.1 AAA family ATPase [Aeromicrobium sp. S22]QGG40158.1 AAA family ATPase [Aeromicrobium yanjiei]
MPHSTQLHVVTGKGGTGKTTVAAALAMSLAGQGKKVLLCEVEGRQGIAQLFDVPPLPYEERQIAVGLGGGEVYALAIDPEAALLEYLAMYYRLGRAGKALDKFGIIDFATTIAPGVRDVLLTGKVYEAARRRDGDSFSYDAVIMDAPPTGRITRFLNVNSEVAGLAKVGPIRRQADSIMEMMRSPQTHVHLVTVLEEMPVQETIDGIAELTSERLPVGHVILNLVRPSLVSATTRDALEDGTLAPSQVEQSLQRVGLEPAAAPDLIEGGLAHLERQRLQDGQRTILEECGVPLVELPLLGDGIDLGALFELADQLGDLA